VQELITLQSGRNTLHEFDTGRNSLFDDVIQGLPPFIEPNDPLRQWRNDSFLEHSRDEIRLSTGSRPTRYKRKRMKEAE
ncbi:hypothetical protein BOW52_10350, partial [Solemya elarraichensis gill symbiont]